MNKLKHIILNISLLIFLATSSVVFGQVSPINSLIKETFNKNGDKEVKKILPDPLQLSGSWWQFFEGSEAAALAEGIEQFTLRLETQLNGLNDEEKTSFSPIVANIKANFLAYAALKARKKSPIDPPKLVTAEFYTLDQLIDIIHLNRDIGTKANRSALEVNDYDKQLRDLRRQADTILVRYLESSAESPARFKEALSIISLQTEIALIDERYQTQKNLLAQLMTQLSDVVKHKDSAIQRLKSTQEESEKLDAQIAEVAQKQQEASARLLREQQSSALITSEETAEDIAVARYRAQRVLHAQIGLTKVDAESLMVHSKKILLTLIDDADIDIKKTQEMLGSYDEMAVELRAKYNNWASQNEVERIRSNEILADSGAKSSENLFLTNVTQDRSNLVQETSISLQRLNAELADIEFLSKMMHQLLLKHQGLFLHSVSQVRSVLSNSWRSVKASLKTSLFKIGDTPVTALGFARLIFIMFMAWWIAFWINKFLIRMGRRGDGEKLPAYYLVGRLTYYSIILIGLLSGLGAIGLDFTNFALVAGALAIGLGFGLQSIVNNFVSGLILLFERSIKVGDFIELQDGRLWGEVKEINVRATIISNNDNVDIIIPNSEFINTKMLNWTLMEPHRRMRYPFRVAYGTDKELVREAVLAAVEGLPHTLKGIPGRNPAVWLSNFGDFYYEFELVVWLTARAVKRPNGVRAAYLWAIDSALREHNIEIPVPQREHRFRSKAVLPLRRYIQEDLNDEIEDDHEFQEDFFNTKDRL